MSFESLGLKRQFLNAIDDLGFTEPTDIQRKAIKPILAGQQLIATAPTGSGKTAAFMLPVMQLLKGSSPSYPRVLVLAPTKELAMQIHSMAQALAAYTDLKFACLIGGTAKKEQRHVLSEGVDIIIGTPGRFTELYLEGQIPLKKLQFLILDEADRLMDMGFLRQLHQVLEVVPTKCRKLLFTATFPKTVQQIADDFIDFPLRISVSKQHKPASSIKQFKCLLKNRLTKLAWLEDWVVQDGVEKVIVFTRTKETADQTAKYLQRKLAEDVGVMHANKSQNTRSSTFKKFREDAIRVLVTTDVSARGIDIPTVSHVVNFDVPLVNQEYVHRAGRTGRAGRAGVSITLYTPGEEFIVEGLETFTGIPMNELTVSVTEREFLPGEEKQMQRALDMHKQKLDPSYRGAFHERKKKIFPPKKFGK